MTRSLYVFKLKSGDNLNTSSQTAGKEMVDESELPMPNMN